MASRSDIPGHGTSGVGVIEIGVGELAIAEAPAVLMTPALGSCVGVTLWDPIKRRGAMAHVMLPTQTGAAPSANLDRFADHAIPSMVDGLVSLGSLRMRLVAKMAGGSAMFRADTVLASVGERNIAVVKEQLELLRIPLIAEDTGGSHARTIELDLETGVLVVRSYVYGIKEL